jgi:dipeptidyl aminopeptidase/acylaminoacyl peptidase
LRDASNHVKTLQDITVRKTTLTALSLVVMAGCFAEPVPVQETAPLPKAREGFKSKLISRSTDRDPVEIPPENIFHKVTFDSPAGKLAAYLSTTVDDGQKHPAIIWITGGDCNSIGDVWSPKSASNDQTAAAFRKAGVIMMFPSLRGGNDNPGTKEGFLGEVNDVLASADYLATQPSVDPQRMYLGGHSTGGTLVLLVAESSDRFRAVFSFGPVSDVSGYPDQFLPFDTSIAKEVELRSPGRWLNSIRSPTFVFEGDAQGNLSSLTAMQQATKNPMVYFHPIPRGDHFSVLAPTNAALARKVVADKESKSNISFTDAELNELMPR